MVTRFAPKSHYLGIDPGKSGAMAIVDADGLLVDVIKHKETQHDLWEWLRERQPRIAFAVLEKVASRPGQGVASTFKFGEQFGFCQGVLVAASIPFELVTPVRWQGVMGCRSKGDKNVTKARAQQLWPDAKVIHATADAMLLAEYARRVQTRKISP